MGATVPYDEPVPATSTGTEMPRAALTKSVENILGAPHAPPVVQHVIQGRPAKVLIDAARDAALLVVGSRGHGGFTGLLLGSVSEHVLAHATCPVVVVHEHRATTGRIVVGVDGSPESSQALRWAARQAGLTGCELHAVLAWHVPFTYGVLDMIDADWAAHGSVALAAAVAGALEERTPPAWGRRPSRTFPPRCSTPQKRPTSWSSDRGAGRPSPASCSAR